MNSLRICRVLVALAYASACGCSYPTLRSLRNRWREVDTNILPSEVLHDILGNRSLGCAVEKQGNIVNFALHGNPEIIIRRVYFQLVQRPSFVEFRADGLAEEDRVPFQSHSIGVEEEIARARLRLHSLKYDDLRLISTAHERVDISGKLVRMGLQRRFTAVVGGVVGVCLVLAL